MLYSKKIIQMGFALCVAVVGYPASADEPPSLGSVELIGSPIEFEGVVVRKTCELALESVEQSVDLKHIDVRTFYKAGHVDNQVFTIKLINCQSDSFGQVRVTFLGTPNPDLVGRLAIPNNNTIGIAIFNQESNELLPLGQKSAVSDLVEGNNILSFSARLEASPRAIVDKTILVQPYAATASFVFEYL